MTNPIQPANAAGAAYYAGVDLGGTKIAAVLLDAQTGAVAASLTVPTQAAEGPTAVIARIAATIRQLAEAHRAPLMAIQWVGVGVPAVIDYALGQTLLMPNLPGDWHRRPIAAELAALLGRPVALINDARAFALAEATYGAGVGAADVACFTVGTGVGGGLVIGGRLHMGLRGSAAEFGHQTIDADGPLCGCGSRGCLETLASGPAISAAGVRTILQGVDSAIGRLAGGDLTQVTPALIKQAADDGDAHAQEILTRAGTALGIGVSNVITLFSPSAVIIGGGVAALGAWIFDPVRATVRARCRTAPVDAIAILPAAVGAYAGAIGAAAWARGQ